MLKYCFVGILLTVADAANWVSPVFPHYYQQALTIPPVKEPRWAGSQLNHSVTGKPITYYELDELDFRQTVYPGRSPAYLRGYDGMYPGPTIIQARGTEAVVRITNRASVNTSTHLHGSASRSPFDGWAEDMSRPGEYKDYYYPNDQSGRTQWYHDHAMDLTAENIYRGLAGMWILRDEEEEKALNLPGPYGKYDIPLFLSSKQYQQTGDLTSPRPVVDNLFGDVIDVNGIPWPYFRVEPKKYRFRFLNVAVSRTFNLYLAVDDVIPAKRVAMNVIASDSGLLETRQTTDSLYLSNGERWEVVLDFAPYRGQNIILHNARKVGIDTDYPGTEGVMRFVVSEEAVAETHALPTALRKVPFPPKAATNQPDRTFTFARRRTEWTINGVAFDDVNQRILARPPLGTVETWVLENRSRGETHPVHVHLVDFEVISRAGGRGAVTSHEAAGVKDVVWLGPGETVVVRAHYAPWPGVYMFHCHNLIHEDRGMMVAFNVTLLHDLGYAETDFLDPMEPRWRPREARPEDYAYEAVEAKIHDLTRDHPYELLAEEQENQGGQSESKSMSLGALLHRVAAVIRSVFRG